MNILVTGGNGFVGTYLVKKLSGMGNNIIVYSQFTRKNPFFEELVKNNSNIDCIQGDITNYKSISSACKNADVIFHLAAAVGDDAQKTFLINGMGTLNVLEAARQESIKRVIFASTAYVYGSPKYLPIDEKHPVSPNSYYGISKLVGELYCKYYYKNYGVDIVILRFASIYGKGIENSYPMKAISIFLRAILKDEAITIYGSGNQFRDYVYIDDVVDAFINAMKRDVSGNVFNIAGGVKVTTMELARMMIKIADKDIKLNKKITKNNDTQDNYVFEITKAKRLLDFRPTPLIEGLKNVLL